MLTTKDKIGVEFSYDSKFIFVDDNKIHYVETGEGNPIVFLPSMPLSNYMWRNVIPYLSSSGRCIAPDYIGSGKSDKPELNYQIADHIHYFEGFINALKLQNITLVLHSWGAMIGLEYARQYSINIKAIAFMEAPVKPIINNDEIALPLEEISHLLQLPNQGYDLITKTDYFVDKILPIMIMRKLTEAEKKYYKEACQHPITKRAIWNYLQELPCLHAPVYILNLIAGCSSWLKESQIPKLMLYAIPGFNTPVSTIMWAKENLTNLSLVDLGQALHFPQETIPQKVGESLASWYRNNCIN